MTQNVSEIKSVCVAYSNQIDFSFNFLTGGKKKKKKCQLDSDLILSLQIARLS